jgi:aminoglycoside 6'-N-acetyltransferase
MNYKEIIKTHNITLAVNGNITLRPMNDNDFDILLKWNSDAEILYFTEGDNVDSYNLEDIHGIYGNTSKTAFCFIIEYAGLPIGECWLQKMNLEHIIAKYSDSDLRRIDIMIGEKNFWNRGIGTEVIKRLVKFGFNDEKADMIFYMPGDYNPRSIKAAEKSGFILIEKIRDENCKKGEYDYIMAIKKEDYYEER